MTGFDPNRLRGDYSPHREAAESRRAGKPKVRLPRHRLREPFLKGPIPMGWLVAAGRCRGRALHVGIALWQQAGIAGSARITLSNKWLAAMGIDADAKRRALSVLEQAGLVTISRRPGRNPDVTILAGGAVGSAADQNV
jgi:hypothetical protein